MAIRVKDGVEFTVIAPGGFEILRAVTEVSKTMGCDLTITSACDGEHSGPLDPHHRGEAYDIRSHDLTADQKTVFLQSLDLDPVHFYAFLESPGADDEHFHCQTRKGTVYP